MEISHRAMIRSDFWRILRYLARDFIYLFCNIFMNITIVLTLVFNWSTVIYNTVFASGAQHSDSVFLQIIFHYRFLQDNGYFLCYAVNPFTCFIYSNLQAWTDAFSLEFSTKRFCFYIWKLKATAIILYLYTLVLPDRWVDGIIHVKSENQWLYTSSHVDRSMGTLIQTCEKMGLVCWGCGMLWKVDWGQICLKAKFSFPTVDESPDFCECQ